MNLVRNHISYYKHKIEETMTPKEYPTIYHRETPSEVNSYYMARPDEIRKSANESLKRYKADKYYQYLLEQVKGLSKTEKKDLCIDNILNYSVRLERAINSDDLVSMHRHQNAEGYLSSFSSCAKKIKKLKFIKFKTMILKRKEVS